MQKLTVLYTEAEKTVLENELQKLFALQDAPLGVQKKGYFIEALIDSGLPVGAIIEGLRALTKQDGLSNIKIGTILGEAYRHLEPAEVVGKSCDKCLRGEVAMKDEMKREYSLACICERGTHVAQVHNLAQWSGEPQQFRKGRWLTIIPMVPLGIPEVVA